MFTFSTLSSLILCVVLWDLSKKEPKPAETLVNDVYQEVVVDVFDDDAVEQAKIWRLFTVNRLIEVQDGLLLIPTE
jgi:hypothetical protein